MPNTLNYRDTGWEKRKEIIAALPGHDFFIFVGPYPVDKEGWFNCVGVRTSDMRTMVVRVLVGGEVEPSKPIFEPGDIEKFLMTPLKEEKPEKKKEER